MDAIGEKEAMVDPFLVEALQNPRHRLTILRMELDVQRFLQNSEHQQFEFQHYPTSYLRLAAHRVAHHYSLVTMAMDGGGGTEASGNRIIARKTSETKYPSVRLSEIPANQPDNGNKPDVIKIAIKPRPNRRGSGYEGNAASGIHKNMMRSVEERKEEYDKARARIFNSSSISDSEDSSSRACLDPNELCLNSNDSTDTESGGTSRVAIIRDREKDLFDPDYDRSYPRYIRRLPSGQNFNPIPMRPQFHETMLMQTPINQASINPSGFLNPPMAPLGHTQWPHAAMMYAHPYDQFTHASSFRGPLYPQPLSFEYMKNR